MNIEPIEERSNMIIAAIVLVALIGLLCHSCVEAVVKTADNQEKYYGKPVTATYDRPAAFRLSSPAPEQMEAYHGLLRVLEVLR